MPSNSIPHSTPRLLLFGDLTRAPFRLWWESLPEAVRQETVFWLKKPEIPPNFLPDFIVLLRSWSGEYSDAEVLEIRRQFPVAPILTIQENWCEGETRNGTPLAGVHALTWYEFIAMAPLEFRVFSEGWATVWSLPPESQPEHRVLFELRRPAFQTSKKGEKPLKFRIESDDFDQFRLLRDFCLRTRWNAGPTSVFSAWTGDSDSKPDFMFVDFPDLNPATVERFRTLKEKFPAAVAVGFLEFPRPDEYRFLREAGVAAIFPKPFRLCDLEYFISDRGEAT